MRDAARWLRFLAQSVVVGLAAAFVVVLLKPELLSRPTALPAAAPATIAPALRATAAA
jgi:hypothetical protein